MENVIPRRWIFHSLSLLQLRSYQFSQGLLRPYFTTWTRRNNRSNREAVRRCLNTLVNSHRFPSFLGRLIYGRLVLLLGTVYCSVSLLTRCFSWFRCTTINLLRTFKALIYFAQQRNVSIFTDFGQYYFSPIFRQFIQR